VNSWFHRLLIGNFCVHWIDKKKIPQPLRTSPFSFSLGTFLFGVMLFFGREAFEVIYFFLLGSIILGSFCSFI
jgi:hypothetical protein